MTQAAKRPSTATLRTGDSQTTRNGYGPRSEHDLRGEQDLVGDRDRDDGNNAGATATSEPSGGVARTARDDQR